MGRLCDARSWTGTRQASTAAASCSAFGPGQSRSSWAWSGPETMRYGELTTKRLIQRAAQWRRFEDLQGRSAKLSQRATL